MSTGANLLFFGLHLKCGLHVSGAWSCLVTISGCQIGCVWLLSVRDVRYPQRYYWSQFLWSVRLCRLVSDFRRFAGSYYVFRVKQFKKTFQGDCIMIIRNVQELLTQRHCVTSPKIINLHSYSCLICCYLCIGENYIAEFVSNTCLKAAEKESFGSFTVTCCRASDKYRKTLGTSVSECGRQVCCWRLGVGQTALLYLRWDCLFSAYLRECSITRGLYSHHWLSD
jgi:hypothetical protein